MKRTFLSTLCVLLLAPAVPAIVDTNSNDLSDLWERANNAEELFPDTFSPNADPDADGWTNAQEATAGTNPFEANPPDGILRPEITHTPAVLGAPDENGVPTVITPEAVTVSWLTIPGKQYTLLYSPDLTAASWLPVGEAFIGIGTIKEYNFLASMADSKFWRVKVEDADTDGDGLTDAEELQIGSSRFLADTDGDGIDDGEAFAAGMNPSGDGSDSDGDGLPDNELYSVVFEIQNEYQHPISNQVAYEVLEGTDNLHRYLTKEESEEYTITGSPRYPDVFDGIHKFVDTYLDDGSFPYPTVFNGSEEGVTLLSWQDANFIPNVSGQTRTYQTTQKTEAEPSINPAEIVNTVTRSTPWEINAGNTFIDSGTEIKVVTDRIKLLNQVTYPQFWTNYVKPRGFSGGSTNKYGPLNHSYYMDEVVLGGASAESLRDAFIKGDFNVSGEISTGGLSYFTPGDLGWNTRLKRIRWRWVRFNPLYPFAYEYAAPPAAYFKRFNFLVERRDFLDDQVSQGNPPSVDLKEPVGVIELECAWNKGVSDWEEIAHDEFNSYKVEDPTNLASFDFSKEGYTSVSFGNLPVEFIPDSESLVSADDHETILVLEVSSALGSPDGSLIEWEIESGNGGTLQESETTVKDGFATVKLITSTTKGTSYVVKARIKRFGPAGPDISESSAWIHSLPIEVEAGKPASIALTAANTNYRSDGTDTSEITSVIKDQYGNLVEDDTPVSWQVDQTPTPPFDSKEDSTTDGIAHATIVAPLVPENQTVSCLAGSAVGSVTVTVSRVTGNIAGNLNLDLGTSQSSTVTATAQAADGTPVYWTTSNGEITAQSVIANGTASATLSPTGGRLGAVAVTATVGDRMLIGEGQFTSTTGLAMGADHPVLVAGATSDGISTPTFAHGIARQIPYYACTPVRIKGAPGTTVKVAAQVDRPLDGWPLETLVDGVTPSRSGEAGHGMTLVNAVIDPEVCRTGVGSLAFSGNGHGSLPDGPAFQFTSQFTVSLWLRPSQHNLATIVGKSGSWDLKQLADGRIQASVTTDTGTHTAITSQALPVNQWTSLALEYRFQRIRVRIGDATAVEATAPGTLVVNNQPVLLGEGFLGHLDDLSFRTADSLNGHATLTGLGTDGTLQLDANGEASFILTSTGTATPGATVQFAAKAEPQAGTGSPSFGSPLDDPDVAEKLIEFADAIHWDTTYDTVMSFVGGDPQTTQGTVSSIAGGLLVVGDVGSTVKNLWRMTGWSEQNPNYVELTLGGLGILTTLPEITGVGAPVDAAVASLKTLAQRFAGNAEALRFLTVFIEQIKNAIAFAGDGFTWAKAKFLRKMVLDVPLSAAFKNFLHDDAIVSAAVRATEKFGDDAAEAFYQAGRRAFDTYGAETAKRFVQIFESLSDEAFDALKNAPVSELDDALECLAKVASKEIAPYTLTRVLNNRHLYGSAYKRTNLMKDMGELADVPGLEGAIKMLKINHRNAKGFRYEIEGAATLKRSGEKVKLLTENVNVIWDDIAEIIGVFGKKFGCKTDIDVITNTGDVIVYRQFKSTAAAMKSPKKVAAWCEKARKAKGNSVGNYEGLMFNLPPDEIPKITKLVKDWLDARNIPILPINMAQ